MTAPAARPSRRRGRPCAPPGVPGPRRRDRGGQRGLARAGRAVDADQPAGAERGRPRTARSRTARVDRAMTGSEREPVAAVRRHLVDELARPEQVHGVRCARTARRTWRAGTRPGRRSASRPPAWPVSGVCTSPAPSSPVRCSPGGAHGVRQPVRTGRTRGDQAAAVHRGDLGRRAAYDGERRSTRPAAARRTGSGRTAPGTSSPEPAVTSVTTGSAADDSTDPEPPAFQNSSVATWASAWAISRRRTFSWSIDAALSRRTTSDRARWPGTSSGTPATWPS